MKATIFSNELTIGTCDLLIGDESMGCLSGEFVPNENYQQIRKHILKFNSSTKPDYKAWSSLRFNVQLETGYFLLAMGGFTFSDMDEFPNDPIRLDIGGVDLKMLELPPDYFMGQKNI